MKIEDITREALNIHLQAVDREDLQRLVQEIEQDACVKIIKTPTVQTLLLPVYDPITGGSFYAGEILATTTVAEVNGSPGWSMVMDDQPEPSRMIAIIDAAFAAGVKKSGILFLVAAGFQADRKKKAGEKSSVEKTRVSFDLM